MARSTFRKQQFKKKLQRRSFPLDVVNVENGRDFTDLLRFETVTFHLVRKSCRIAAFWARQLLLLRKVYGRIALFCSCQLLLLKEALQNCFVSDWIDR